MSGFPDSNVEWKVCLIDFYEFQKKGGCRMNVLILIAALLAATAFAYLYAK